MELQTLFGKESSARTFLLETKMRHIFYSQYNNGVTFVPDSKPVALKPRKSPGFPCRIKNGGSKGGKVNFG
jgi:hypothetical protein